MKPFEKLLETHNEVYDIIEKILHNTRGVVVPDVNDIHMFFRGGGKLETHHFTLLAYLSEMESMKEKLDGYKANLLLVAELHSHEHIKELFCWNDAPNIECFVPAVYINNNNEESVTIIIRK